MTEERAEQLTKRVEFTAKDESEQVAAGIVMVPDKVDLQRDFAREGTIRDFSEQFENFVNVGEADGGVMHAVWPSEAMDLERNEVLDEAADIGNETVDAGAWVQEWKFNDEGLWSLVEDGILEGYSIGAVDVDWNGPFEQDEVEDVEVPDEIEEDELIWELTDGIIREVSAVDIPAVPDAMILETKDAYEKRLADHLGNREGFISEAMDRGHTESEAERLWEELNRLVDIQGAGEPGDKSLLARAGKAALSVLSGTDDGTNESEDLDPAASKEGRTLSRQNRESLFATIDASLDVLEDAGVNHGMSRFTDRDDWAFDLTEHSARTWENPDDEDEEEEEEEPDGEETENAAGSDTPDDKSTMSDTDPLEDAPEWARSLHDSIEENSKRLDEQADKVEAALEAQEEEKTAQIEIDGEVYEVTESEAKSWFEDGEQPDSDPMDDAPDYVRALNEKVEGVTERIERINRQSGQSDQIDAAFGGSGKEENGDDGDGLKALGEALS